jgi:NAD(P)-dependent dehydrogenase (short-subunit alcohol dehydrogenase family)
MIEYEKAVADYSYIDKGYPISAYMMSKLGINIYATKILPKLDSIIRKQIQVYCQCPGYVSTDMTDHKGFLPVEKGALTTVYLAELPFEVNP